MKVEVIKKFKNKYSKSIHDVGDVLDVSEKRFEEINSTSCGAFVKEIERKPKK